MKGVTWGTLNDDNSTLKGVKNVIRAPYCHFQLQLDLYCHFQLHLAFARL